MSTPASAFRPSRPHAEISAFHLRTVRTARQIDVLHDPETGVVETRLRATAPGYVSSQLLDDLGDFARDLRLGRFGVPAYRLLSSAKQGVFSLGGDLAFFLAAIEAGRQDHLMAYGLAAIDQIWANLSGGGLPSLTTLALVEGEAQGGGFEAALSCHGIVAEEGAAFGFPERLFGLFPGMGAHELLAARTDEGVAKHMLKTASRYTAEMLFDLGIVDFLVPKGQGVDFVREFCLYPPGPAVERRKRQLRMVRFEALRRSVEAWVAQAMAVSEQDRRFMRYILAAQQQAAATPSRIA